jgi:predicted transcriptional regulator with HTH domain
MPPISKEKQNKIKEQILYYLYSQFPKQPFTSDIARELARDEEFIKRILLEINKDLLIVKIEKNSKGIRYLQRIRWRISNKAYKIYSNNQ